MAKERYHHGDLRGALLDAAETLVRERGADGWSLREASARVGVSPSAAYHHFGSRDALASALSEVVLARLGNRLRDTMDAAPEQGPERLAACGRAYVTWAVEDPAVARLVFRGGATTAQSAISPHPHEVLTTELDRLTDTGHLPAEPARAPNSWSGPPSTAWLSCSSTVSYTSTTGKASNARPNVWSSPPSTAWRRKPPLSRTGPCPPPRTHSASPRARPPARHHTRPHPEVPRNDAGQKGPPRRQRQSPGAAHR